MTGFYAVRFKTSLLPGLVYKITNKGESYDY